MLLHILLLLLLLLHILLLLLLLLHILLLLLLLLHIVQTAANEKSTSDALCSITSAAASYQVRVQSSLEKRTLSRFNCRLRSEP